MITEWDIYRLREQAEELGKREIHIPQTKPGYNAQGHVLDNGSDFRSQGDREVMDKPGDSYLTEGRRGERHYEQPETD